MVETNKTTVWIYKPLEYVNWDRTMAKGKNTANMKYVNFKEFVENNSSQ